SLLAFRLPTIRWMRSETGVQNQGDRRSEAVGGGGRLAVVRGALDGLDARRFALLALCLVFFAAGLATFTDPDYWWHLKTGELILHNHAVPRTDPFSYTAAGKHWVAHEWLSEVIIYGVQSLLGYWADVVLFTSA